MQDATITDPLELLIEKEERIKRDERDEANTSPTPCLVPIPNFFKKASADPFETMIALSDPEEILRQAIAN